MPRIDPVKLLSCIGVLLSPNGGIRSAPEVKRLAGLMCKYSKKLVSKCIYIQILKCTETELLGQFMTVGGWTLVHSWLIDGIESKNWPLVQELLELLLLCPVDVPRLQSNSAPKLVKGLSREEENEGVRILATRLVEQWLKIARGEISSQNPNVFNKENLLDPQSQINVKPSPIFSEQNIGQASDLNAVDGSLCVSEINENDVTDGTNETGESIESEGLVFKITMKDGKQTLAKINEMSPKKLSNRNTDMHKESEVDDHHIVKVRTEKIKDERRAEKDGKDRDKSRDHHRKSSSSSSSHKSSSNSSSSSKSSSKHSSSNGSNSSKSASNHSKTHKSSSSSSSSGHKSSSSSSSRDKDRHKSSSSSTSKSTSSGSSSSSSSKDKKSESTKTQAEKDKDTLAKIQPKSLEKVGKIPKKVSTDDSNKKTTENEPPVVPKKKSISIEQRKDPENRPKTVKTYNSQFRSHGLGEEAPPPPSRRDLKKPAAVPANGMPIVPKRSLSPTATAKEVEKKIKLSTSPTIEKPGAIKLIPAKPKPSVLVESDMFMDAISAATTKKEVRKRKRIPSTTKESENNNEKLTPSSKDGKDATKAVTPAPLRFYQDTLEENESKEDSPKSDGIKKELDTSDDTETSEKKIKLEDAASEDQTRGNVVLESAESPDEPEEEIKREPGPGCGPDGPPGVLTIHRRKGPKKSLRWKPQEALEEIRYFELDETERVNVTKPFVDMKQMDLNNEREAFLISRKANIEDVMTEQIPWGTLILVDDVPEHAIKSKEKDIQTEREKTCLKTIYFSRAMIPDSPLEPDVIAFQNVEPPTIPLYDITGNTDAIHDFTNMPWPEAKGSPPHQASNMDDLNGISNFGAFTQFNNINWPAQNNMLAIRPPQIGLMMPPEALNPLNMNAMHPFQAPPIAPMMGQLPPNNMGFINNFAPGMPPIMNDQRANRGNNWFGANNNAGNNNWPAQAQNNNNNQRNNWIGNRRICKQFQRGHCRHGKTCKFLHPNENNFGPKF